MRGRREVLRRAIYVATPDLRCPSTFSLFLQMQRELQDYLLLMLYLYLPRAMPQSWRDVDLDVFPRRES
jgi:hypothetical protein